MTRGFFRSLLILAVMGMAAFGCSRNTQVSGIIAEAQFSTIACQPKSKIISIRNEDTSEPQRIQGVSFEMGTNDQSNFKIDKVTVGGTDLSPSANMVQEVIIPAGGVMGVQVTYNPRAVTQPGSHDTSYMDIFLNGPQLGILQVRLTGEAPTAAEGCGTGPAGTQHVFKVDKIKVTVRSTALPGGEFLYEVPQNEITKDFKFGDNAGTATTLKDDFPDFNIKGDSLPGGQLGVVLEEDATGTFNSGSGVLTFDPIAFRAGGAIVVSGKLTTEPVNISGTDGSSNVSLTGSALAGGKMKLVFATVLNDPILSSSGLNGGVVGFELDLTEK